MLFAWFLEVQFHNTSSFQTKEGKWKGLMETVHWTVPPAFLNRYPAMEFRVNKSFHTEKREQAVVESALVFTVLWRVPPCLDSAGCQGGCLSYARS